MSDELDKDWRDHTALVTRIASSLVPLVGGPLGEVIVGAIPRLRQDRIVEYLRLLERKFDNVKKGEYPPFDPKSGGFKSRIQISYLGKMLLKEAGISLPY